MTQDGPQVCISHDGESLTLPVEVHPCSRFTQPYLKGRIQAAVHLMSERTRWNRFASPNSILSDDQLDYLADLDDRDRMAWCASVVIGGERHGVGLARYIRLAGDPEVAEFAIVIVDPYQGQGVGRHLMDRLIGSARDNGIATLRGFVLPSNDAMLSLGRSYPHREGRDGDFVQLDLTVPPAA